MSFFSTKSSVGHYYNEYSFTDRDIFAISNPTHIYMYHKYVNVASSAS